MRWKRTFLIVSINVIKKMKVVNVYKTVLPIENSTLYTILDILFITEYYVHFCIVKFPKNSLFGKKLLNTETVDKVFQY